MTVSASTEEVMRPPKRMGMLFGEDSDNMGGNLSGGFEVNKRQLAEIGRYFDMLVDPDLANLQKSMDREDISAIPSGQVQEKLYREPDMEDRTIRVTNLPEYVEEGDVRKLFGRCGEVVRCFLARNSETKVSKGFAFITFKTRLEAESAISRLHKAGFQNVLLNVEWAKKKTEPTQ